MTSNTKILSFEEVSMHNRKTDCWLIISGKVYDVTPFLDDHPGGAEALLLATEKDATEDFETVGHSQDAKDQMKDYYVGELDNNTMPQENGYNLPSTTASASNQAPGSSSTNILTFVLPVLILILAFALYYYPKIEMAV
ncbi:putative cytochrome b5-like heme/steroid binding domain, cytochrome b5, heme-binding protein [Helianthus annuus]|nr:putative cytochrome b5-like heme/steroid binding domain, cytochrome b5, heme-binding protein [Helianthus annuus]